MSGPAGWIPQRAPAASVDSPSLFPVVASPTVISSPVRAIAVAHEKCNTIGTVELCCLEQGLHLHFVSVSAFRDGYVPFPTTSLASFVIPYDKIVRVVLDDEKLVHLTLAPDITPHHRLVLAGLVRDPKADHASSHRRRVRIERRITMLAMVLWIPIAVLMRLAFPNESVLFSLGVCATISGTLHYMRTELANRLILFGGASLQVRHELLGELRWRLAPSQMQDNSDRSILTDSDTRSNTDEPDDPSSLRGLFVTAGLAAGVAAVALVLARFALPQPASAVSTVPSDELDGERLAAVSAVPPTTTITPEILPPVVIEPCVCARSDSSLWEGGVPRMSVLAHNRPGRTSQDKPSVYPEIAVVNNQSAPLEDIVMAVDFVLSARDGRKERVLRRQDLFWEGELAPGKAVKWRVKGRGDDFLVTSFVDGTLREGVDPAPADAFFELTQTATTPSVRLHGAKMLAYLGDPRAGLALEKLRSEGRNEFSQALQEMERAIQPLRVCSVRPEMEASGEIKLHACLFNASANPIENPRLTATAQAGEQRSVHTWKLPSVLKSGEGARVQNVMPSPYGVRTLDEVSISVETTQ